MELLRRLGRGRGEVSRRTGLARQEKGLWQFTNMCPTQLSAAVGCQGQARGCP